MVVDRKTRRVAMLRICRAIGAHDSALVHAEDLEREWRATGLRGADLDSALREMVQRQWLVAREVGAHRNYELTDAGLREFHRARGTLWLDLTDALTLLRARLRAWLTMLLPEAPRPVRERRLETR